MFSYKSKSFFSLSNFWVSITLGGLVNRRTGQRDPLAWFANRRNLLSGRIRSPAQTIRKGVWGLVNRPKPPDNEYGVSLTGQNRRITSMGLVNRQKRSYSLSGGPLRRLTRPLCTSGNFEAFLTVHIKFSFWFKII